VISVLNVSPAHFALGVVMKCSNVRGVPPELFVHGNTDDGESSPESK
jgi:hypothetical protein